MDAFETLNRVFVLCCMGSLALMNLSIALVLFRIRRVDSGVEAVRRRLEKESHSVAAKERLDAGVVMVDDYDGKERV